MPKYWPTWLGLGCLYALCLLPYRFQIHLGKYLGDLMYLVFRSRRHITEVNIRLCFPEKSLQQQKHMVREVFRHNAIGMLETSMAWWMSDKRLKVNVTFKGQHHIEEALAQNKGVILLGGHFSTLDMGGRLFTRFFPADVMYREHNNPLMEIIIKASREIHLTQAIERESLRSVLRALRKNHIVWYAPDQDFGPRHSVYAPFFGIDAATIPATSRMVKLNDSPILMLAHHRTPDNKGYELEVFPIISDFPSGDDVKDATRINAELEKGIRKDPAQYMWVHRRFKTHPKGKNYLYRRSRCHQGR